MRPTTSTGGSSSSPASCRGQHGRFSAETNAPGGQAGSSLKIENYLGFPTRISGQALAGRAYTQGTKVRGAHYDRQARQRSRVRALAYGVELHDNSHGVDGDCYYCNRRRPSPDRFVKEGSKMSYSMTRMGVVRGMSQSLRIVLLLLLSSTAASAQNPDRPVRNIVLVHGAWADGSGWKGVYDILVKGGYKVSIVQEPETSL